METVNYARSRIPDFSFSTDIIIGFPNETAEDFADTMKIVKQVKYDNIFSFIYSKRTGTKAAVMDDFTSNEEKKARMIVRAEADASVIGKVRKVRITKSFNWALQGEII